MMQPEVTMKRSELKPWAQGMTCAELAEQCKGKCPMREDAGECKIHSGCLDVIKEDWCELLGEEAEKKENPTSSVKRGGVLMAAHDVINGARQDQYGNPEDNFARIANYWSQYTGHEFSAHDVAMMMALLKIARIQNGSGKNDSYTDLCGYAALAADMEGNHG